MLCWTKSHRRVSPLSIEVDVRYVAPADNVQCIWRVQKVKPWLCSFFPLLLLNISNAAISRCRTEGRPSSRAQDLELRLEQWLTPQSCLLQRARAALSRSIMALAAALAWHFYKYRWGEMDISLMLTFSVMDCFLDTFFYTFFIYLYFFNNI